MADNPYVNKVDLADGTTIMDISDTTATPNDVLSGQVFYTASGARSVGSVDLSGKADKVGNATSGNFAALDSTGNLTDSGSKASDFLTTHQDISGKVDKTTVLANGTDLNTAVTSGFYRLGTGHVNAPASSDYSQMIVSRGGDTIFQTIGIWGTGKVYTRTGNNIGTSSATFTAWEELTNKANKVSGAVGGNFAALSSITGDLVDSGKRATSFIAIDGASQWINSGTGATGFGIANNIVGNSASLKADSEGGNVTISKNSKYAEFDTYGMQTDGSGYARIVVDNASSYKTFKLQQDGNFVDGNNVSTGALNRDKLNSSSIAIAQTTDNATQNIEKGQFVVWHGNPCTASSAIASGDTLSSSNLSLVSKGLFNLLHKAFITEEYTYSYDGLADGGYLAVSATDFGITEKTGYKLAGCVGYATGSYNIYAYGVLPRTTGTIMSLRNKSGTSVTQTVTCRVSLLWVKDELM